MRVYTFSCLLSHATAIIILSDIMNYQHLPYGWLDSRVTTHEERETLFGDDPMDAGY